MYSSSYLTGAVRTNVLLILISLYSINFVEKVNVNEIRSSVLVICLLKKIEQKLLTGSQGISVINTPSQSQAWSTSCPPAIVFNHCRGVASRHV